ncbi:MAG: choice-of-anchor M domain-containing protein [Verrucomicrobiota bacterium]
MNQFRWFFCVVVVSGLVTSGKAQFIYSGGHGDIGVGYDEVSNEFEPHWHLDAGAIVDGSPLTTEEEYEPGDMNARTSTTRNSPSGLNSIIGVADGSTIYAMGSATFPPNLGLSTEELTGSDWIGNVTISLTNWTLPTATADFALFTTNLAGTTVVDRLFSTHSPGSTDFSNGIPLVVGDHAHFDWGFTELGTYEFEFTWTGTHVIDGAISTPGTFSVEVVPEPSAVVLLGLGMTSILAIRRRLNQSRSK